LRSPAAERKKTSSGRLPEWYLLVPGSTGSATGAEWILYRFADYKEKVIDLLARVTTVSVETVRITCEMRDAPR
jgi:hypothetical protein